MGRLGTADEMGEIAVFLASDAAAYVTGEILHRRRRMVGVRVRLRRRRHV